MKDCYKIGAVWPAFLDDRSVSIDDLINQRPGAIVRVSSLPAVEYLEPVYVYDNVAGMISEDV